MTNGELHNRLDDLLDKAGAPWFTTAEKDTFLNLAALEFVKQTYMEFEKNEKKRQDIAPLVRTVGIDTSQGGVGKTNCVMLEKLPKLMFLLNMFGVFKDTCSGKTISIENPQHDVAPVDDAEEIGTESDEMTDHALKEYSHSPGIEYANVDNYRKTYTNSIKSSIRPIQLDDLHGVENDPFNKPTDKYPLYVVRGDVWSHGYIEIYSDNFPIAVWMDYLKEPKSIDTTTNGTTATDLNLPEHTHDEVVNIAVRKMLENIEDFPRYQAQQVEIIEQNK